MATSSELIPRRKQIKLNMLGPCPGHNLNVLGRVKLYSQVNLVPWGIYRLRMACFRNSTNCFLREDIDVYMSCYVCRQTFSLVEETSRKQLSFPDYSCCISWKQNLVIYPADFCYALMLISDWFMHFSWVQHMDTMNSALNIRGSFAGFLPSESIWNLARRCRVFRLQLKYLQSIICATISFPWNTEKCGLFPATLSALCWVSLFENRIPYHYQLFNIYIILFVFLWFRWSEGIMWWSSGASSTFIWGCCSSRSSQWEG